MFFLNFQVHPNANEDSDVEFEVGYAACWIEQPDAEKAEIAAARLIRESGWHITQKKDCKVISKDDYRQGDDGLNYYNQAIVDGEVIVIYAVEKSEP